MGILAEGVVMLGDDGSGGCLIGNFLEAEVLCRRAVGHEYLGTGRWDRRKNTGTGALIGAGDSTRDRGAGGNAVERVVSVGGDFSSRRSDPGQQDE